MEKKPQMEMLRVTYLERNNFTVDNIRSHGSVSDGALYKAHQLHAAIKSMKSICGPLFSMKAVATDPMATI
eukprot:scaffold6422_cov69-Cyclotella_meneghiniana.AAC.1